MHMQVFQVISFVEMVQLLGFCKYDHHPFFFNSPDFHIPYGICLKGNAMALTALLCICPLNRVQHRGFSLDVGVYQLDEVVVRIP